MGAFEKLVEEMKISYHGMEDFMWLENEEIIEEHSGVLRSNNPKDNFLTVYDIVKEKYMNSMKNVKMAEFRNSLLFSNGSEHFAMLSHRSFPNEIQSLASRMKNYSRFFLLEITGKAWVFYEVKRDSRPKKTIRLFNSTASPYLLISWTLKFLKTIAEKEVVEKRKEIEYDMMNPRHYISLSQTFTLENNLKSEMIKFANTNTFDNDSIKDLIFSYCIKKFNTTAMERNKFYIDKEILCKKNSFIKIYIFTKDSQKDLFDILKQKNKHDKQAVYYININSQSIWTFGILNKDLFLKQSESIQCSAMYTKECMGLDLICNMIQYILLHSSVNLK